VYERKGVGIFKVDMVFLDSKVRCKVEG